ncbi:hypothetical protein FLONG3_9259 [Fusarium longipes]|uniref:Uncharacterized protein n=1 Tax=Fusarium longipes TaxID=694270 RepID=A0A395RYP5_9HYPO|nr:hypothetical protein FLONG3_9259 [Fusarium longipes]
MISKKPHKVDKKSTTSLSAKKINKPIKLTVPKPAKTAPTKPTGDAIIVGLDFGTTYSGIAWAYSRQPDEIALVTNWEAQLRSCSDLDKVPTQLLYDGDRMTHWGYSIPADENPLKWFKLMLLRDNDITNDMTSSSQIVDTYDRLTESGQDAVSAVACFLGEIWKHAMDSILRALGPELLKKSRFHVVITLPAIWPPYTQHRMRKAANMSGILDPRPCGATQLSFISEPEAAALATLKDFSKRSTINPRDTMVICDAGGGTVDLISYEIDRVDPFHVKECVKGDGGLCGAVFLDENFLKLIKNKLHPGAWKYVSKAQEKKFLNDEWEHTIKEQFGRNMGRTWLVYLPESCNIQDQKGKRRKTLELTSDDLLTVFNPVIDKIEALVRRQTDAIQAKYHRPAKYISLVGGFGRSPYLFDRLRESTGCQVLQESGNKPWTAICRGAVVSGAAAFSQSSITVDTRIARMSYGTSFIEEFDRKKGHHRVSDRIWSEDEQIWYADNQMKWFLREGRDMSSKNPVREKYYRAYAANEEEIEPIVETIYVCSTYPPPRNMRPTVEKLCEITWTRDIDIESLPTATNPSGELYYKLEYEIQMTCDEGIVNFNVFFQGTCVGARHIDVNFQ